MHFLQFLIDFSLGPEWDSSDEEIVEPKATKKIAKKKQNAEQPKSKKESKREETEDSRVIYMGHIPPAFEEPQILQFLSQFGKVTNVKLSRSRRTGNPRGYAFVEFADNAVAAIVADTMSGYFLMGERRLVCHIVPQDKIHPDLFKGAKANLAYSQAGHTSSYRLKILHDKQRKQTNAPKSVEQLNKITKRLLSREKKKREQLKALGIDYDFPGYTTSSTMETKKRKVSDDEGDVENVSEKKVKKETQTPNKSTSKRKNSEEKADSLETKTPTKKAASKKVESAKKSSSKRKNSEDKTESLETTMKTPTKKVSSKKVETEVKKKKSKSATKKRRKSVA